MRKLIVAFTVSLILVSLGFNTLDWLTWHPMQQTDIIQTDGMVWRFDYQPVWHLNSWLSLDIWNAYFFAGILPLALGSGLFASCITTLWLHSKEE